MFHENLKVGILSLYVLSSLKRKPKSGYELIKEIKEKSGDGWEPSKGTIYPILKRLKQDKLIQIKKAEKIKKNKRRKIIFQLTSNGKKMLTNVIRHGTNFEKKFGQFKSLFDSIFNELLTGRKDRVEIKKIFDLSFEIRKKCFSIKNKEKVINVLENCLSKLDKLQKNKE